MDSEQTKLTDYQFLTTLDARDVGRMLSKLEIAKLDVDMLKDRLGDDNPALWLCRCITRNLDDLKATLDGLEYRTLRTEYDDEQD